MFVEFSKDILVRWVENEQRKPFIFKKSDDLRVKTKKFRDDCHSIQWFDKTITERDPCEIWQSKLLIRYYSWCTYYQYGANL